MSRSTRFDWHALCARKSQKRRRRGYRRRFRAESLEDRRVLSVEASIVSAPLQLLEQEEDLGFGQVLSLDGVDDHVSVPSDIFVNDYNPGLPFTVETWVRVDPEQLDQSTGLHSIIDKSSQLSDYSYAIQYDSSTGLLVASLSDGSDTLTISSLSSINDGHYHHVAFVRGLNTFSLYVDGQLQGSLSNLVVGTTSNLGALYFGQQGNGNSSFRGEIDEVRIWDIARTESEIQSTMLTQLVGNEPGLQAYYNFDDETATDLRFNNDGSLVNGPSFIEYADPSVVGFVEVRLSAPVDVEPGIIVNYEIDPSSTAIQGVDFYASQLDLVTVDDSIPVTNSVFIPTGADSAIIALAALPDAIDELNETIIINLTMDKDPFQTGTPDNYTIGAESLTAVVTLVDSDLYAAGLALTNVFGEDAAIEGLHLDANGQAVLSVKLTSQPEQQVTVNLPNNTTGGVVSGAPLVFEPDNWDTPQTLTLSGLSGDGDKIEDLLGVLSFSAASSDSNYSGQSVGINVYDESDTTKVRVDEDGDPQPITPTVSVRTDTNMIEGSGLTGVVTFSSDVAAPAGGLVVHYSLVDDSGLGTQYDLVDDGEDTPGVRTIIIPEGELSASVLVLREDDEIASGDLLVSLEVEAQSAYQLGAAITTSVLLEEDDQVGIQTATLMDVNGTQIVSPFDETTLLTTSEGGAPFTFGVRLSTEPTSAVTVTISSTNTGEGQISSVLVFDDTNWDQFQTATVVPQDDALLDGDRPYNILVESTSSDASYLGLDANFQITNQDDESREEEEVDITDDSTIIATLSEVELTGVEGGVQPQFEIQLSEPAPEGGLTVAYNVYERSATNADLGLPSYVEQLGDGNPLALTQVESPQSEGTNAESLTFADLDGDGDQDALLSMDDGTTQLLINEGTDEVPDFVVVEDLNPLLATGGYGSAIGDVDGDGDLDVIQVNPAKTGVLYFESQLADSGAFTFVERTAGDNPFSSLVLSDPESPALVDLNNDGAPELVVTSSSSSTINYYEPVGSFYAVAGANPFVGLGQNSPGGITFGDVDGDGDLDAYVGGFDTVAYLENFGTPTDPLFVERTGAENPTDSIDWLFTRQYPALVDINNDGDLDLFSGSRRFTGEVTLFFEVRYFDSPEFQEVVVPEGQTSLVVTLPIVDDIEDEAAERFEIALVSQQTETYDFVASADFDDQYAVEIVEVFGDSLGLRLVNELLENIQDLELLAGTVLDFGSGQVTVTTTTGLDDNSFSILTPVSFDAGVVNVGDVATATLDDTVSLYVPFDGDLFNGTIGLQIEETETTDAILLEAGTQLTFNTGVIVEVTQTIVVTPYEMASIPVTVIGAGTVSSGDTVDFSAPIGELDLVVDEPGVDFYALAVGTKLTLSDGSVFVVTTPAVVASSAGDYNGDGLVDAADYTVWRDNLGSTSNLDADGDENGVVDQGDYDLWVENYGAASGVAVTGYIASGPATSVSATATITEAGYRTQVDLLVTAAYDAAAGTMGLLINEAEYDSFTIPAGTTFALSGGAFVTLDNATVINNSTGTLVEVTPTSDPETTTILTGETTGTASFFSSLTVIAAFDGVDDGFLLLDIVDPSVTSFELTAGTELTFTQSDVTVSVVNTVTLTQSTTAIEVQLVEGDFISDILQGDTAVISGFESVGSLEFLINDNDEANVLFNISDTTTSETGDSETIEVTLATRPTEDVLVIMAVDGDEAVLSDDDETNQDVIQLLFTPLNWDVAQMVTVTGVDDEVDDGLTQYTLRTTTLSADTEYTDDVVEVFFPFDLQITVGSLQVDDISVIDTVLPQNTLIVFENGAVVQADVTQDVLLRNDSATGVDYTLIEPVDQIPAGETATAYDIVSSLDDFQTNVEVDTGYDENTGVVGMLIESAEGDVASATLLAGYQFTFSNGTVAELTADTTILGGGLSTLFPVTLIEGTEIPTGATTVIFETLDVTTAYDLSTGDIGLQVADPLISSITFNANTEFEFSNGAYGTIASQTTITSTAEEIVNLTVATNRFSSQASGYFTEQLVDDVVFTNEDDDTGGVTIRQTDPTLAVTEGASNNFFTVVLESEPTGVVEITLTPADDNLQLEDEFMGEAITLFFDPLTWNLPQTVEVSAVDDVLLEYDHMSTIDVTVTSAEDGDYDTLAPPKDIEVYITDDEQPYASIIIVAGAIEANSPGYFIVELDEPAPQGPDNTGIVITYMVGGTADAVGGVDQTPDLQPFTGTVRIAPGETQSALIAFPIDDFVAEGVNLVVNSAYNGESTISLSIDTAPFVVGMNEYNSSNQTVDLLLDSLVENELETTILSQGTVLDFGGATAIVSETVIIRDDLATVVPIELQNGADGSSITEGDMVYQEILIPDQTELKFGDETTLTVDGSVTVTNQMGGSSIVVLDGTGISIAQGEATAIPGESVVISLTTDVDSEYKLGGAPSAAMTILDNDKPGVRIAELGSSTVVVEGESSTGFSMSLLSQPQDTVTITLVAPTTTVELVVDQQYADDSAGMIGLTIADSSVVSLSLPAGFYDFDGVSVEVLEDVTLFSAMATSVPVAFAGSLLANATADYTYNELLFENGTNTTQLVFEPNNWFLLQSVSFAAVDDLVVEEGDSHATELMFTVFSLDPNYNNFEIAPLPVTIIDRRFDIANTYQAVAEGFLTIEQSLESITLPIVGDFGEVAPSIVDTFLESLTEEILATENLTAETLGDAFENALSAQFVGLPIEFLVTEISAEELGFSLSFGDEFLYQIDLNSDLGLEALGISVQSEGTLDFLVEYGFSISFGVSQTEGFFFNTEETSLEVAASLTLSDDFSATGSLGFLQLDVANGVNFADAAVDDDFEFDSEIDNVIRLDVTGDFEAITLAEGDTIVIDSGGEEVVITVGEEFEIDGPGVYEIPVSDASGPVFIGDATVLGDPDGTMIDAGFVVTLEDVNDTSGDDTRLTLAEISAARASDDPYSFISYGFSGEAVLDLDIATTVSGNTAFPSFSFNLASNLPLFNYADEDEAGADETPSLEVTSGFTNVAEGALATLTLSAMDTSSDVRLAKGTELNFGGVKVVVDKTVTLASDGTPLAVQVRVADDGMPLTTTQTISVGAADTLASSGFDISFNDITLDLGGFVTDLLGPVISGINDVIDPFQPVIDVLTTDVQFLSTIGLAGAFDTDDDGAATLLEVALTLGGGLNGDTAEKFNKFADAVVSIIDLTGSLADLEQSIEDGGTLAINFGSYTLENFKGGSSSADATTVDVEMDGSADDADMSPEDQTMSTGNSDVTGFFSSLDDLGITLDVIENPLNVIKLFLGQDIDLVTWDVPELDLSFTIEREFPVVLGIRGLLIGEFNVYSDLVFGFDTFGFSQWKEEDFAIGSSYLVFDGFYVSDIDPETGEDIPELTIDATLAAGLEANAVFASISAIGGVNGSATLDLIDVGEYSGESDGRVRGSEVFSRISRPASLFELTGSIDAFLQITVSVGIDLGFWSIEKVVYERELARVTLFEFTIGGGGGGGSSSFAQSESYSTTDVIEAATDPSPSPAPEGAPDAEQAASVSTSQPITANLPPEEAPAAGATLVALEETVAISESPLADIAPAITGKPISESTAPAISPRERIFADFSVEFQEVTDVVLWQGLAAATQPGAALLLFADRRQRLREETDHEMDFDLALEDFQAEEQAASEELEGLAMETLVRRF